MKAIINTAYGPPEIAQLMEVEKPVPRDNEVLIKIHAATVNRTDCGFRSAEYFISRFFSGLIKPKNHTLGNEFAGVVEEAGKAVTSFKVDDKVFGYNDQTFGAHAEYMIMAENGNMATMPNNVTFDVAAATCEGGHYALCDIRAAKVKSGQEVLVNGATGAIGSAAVQLLKHFGAIVTAVCDSKNVELITSLNPDFVIDYQKKDFTKLGKTFDFVFDAVGKSSFEKCKPILKKKGVYISTELGRNWENIYLALITPLFGGKVVRFPIPTINQQDVLFLKGLVETGRYNPLVDRKYPLEQIVDAYRYVETGQKTGNVIITLN